MARFDSYSAKIRIFRIFQNRVKVVPWHTKSILIISQNLLYPITCKKSKLFKKFSIS